jgi:hypothetical protein
MVSVSGPPRAQSWQAASRIRFSSSGSGRLGNLQPPEAGEIPVVLQVKKEESETRDYSTKSASCSMRIKLRHHGMRLHNLHDV